MDDALRPAPDASYEAQLARPFLDEREHELAARMIGRPLRGRSAAAARCGWGLPAVLRVQPQLADGTPFPTTFWLACPLARSHVGRLEAGGAMARLNERLATDEALAAAYAGAHERYVEARDRLGPAVPGQPSAGGMPARVKCLHALYAHQLATGDNPVGAWVGEQVEPMACPAPCVELDEGKAPAPAPPAPAPRTAPAPPAPAPAPATRYAAIDAGTNSTRLLVAEPADPLRTIQRDMRVTRLGKGVDATGHLDDDALERTLACIEEYAAAARALGASALRVAATSAVRDAADRERFFAGVRARAGVEAEVLSGEREAATAFAGATASADGQPPYCVLDIGGGSTELIVGTDAPEASTSRQLGCVRLTERALHGDPPGPGEVRAAISVVDAELEAAVSALGTAAGLGTATGTGDPRGARTLVGVAGTVTTLGALYLDLPAYSADEIHGTRMPLDAVRELTDRLARMTSADRAALGPMAPGREDVIVGGALILQRVMERLGFNEVLVSEADGLDGLVLQMLPGVSGRAPARRPRA